MKVFLRAAFMFWNLNTIGKRLFLAFSILALNAIIICSISYHFILRNKSIYDLTKRIENERTQIVRLLKLDLDFLRFETINQEFYATGKSALLIQRDSLYKLILHETALLHNSMYDHSLGIESNFDSINNTLRDYNNTFNKIKEKISYRGFKDYGVEGSMRKYAHELERHPSAIDMVHLLTLRRHEKDYFLRKENHYKTQFNELCESLKTSIPKGSDHFAIHLLKSYQDNFNQLAILDEAIGLLPTEGLMGDLNNLTNQISEQLTTLVTVADERANDLIKQSLYSYISISLLAIVVSFAFTYLTAVRLTKPIKKLSLSISRYIVHQGLDEEELRDPAVTNEINSLSSAFIKMSRKLKAQFNEIQRKSKLLENRNQELQKLNEELDRFIYSSAHDLKSPLASMSGLVHLAEREMQVPEHVHYFEKMRSSIEKMEGFIKDITDYAKNKRQQINPVKINMEVVLSDIFQSFQFIPHADSIEKSIEISSGEFYTDKTRLDIILKNIISNAIRYADLKKSNRYLRIHVSYNLANTIIRIADNGIGIAEEHLPRIFEMFYRATDNAKGSGIGLFLVRESVKMLRGTITVESEFQKGSTFILDLPNLKQVNVDQLPESEPIRVLTA